MADSINYQLAKFVASYGKVSQIPESTCPEVSFVGRSNVGKSSIMNKLFGRKNLVKVSSTPGKTSNINFFEADDVHFVDLPGYGFAKAPVAVVAKWQALLRAYLAGRQTLRRAFVLIDTRHGVKAVDEEILKLLNKSAVTFQVVMTKSDKVNAATREANIAQVQEALKKHPAAYPEIILTSSETGEGIETLRAVIATMT